ncbi:MAG: hypothetical protein M9894_20700 [Planctomycetes bacterium]|nr:hypothetical protein [Planctomycetota bacterium]
MTHHRDLFERLRSGDRAAGDALVDALRAPMMGVIATLLYSEAECEDALHDAWLAALRKTKPPDRTDDEGFQAWMVGIARNVARRRRKKQQGRPAQLEVPGDVVERSAASEVDLEPPGPRAGSPAIPAVAGVTLSPAVGGLWLLPDPLATAARAALGTVHTWDELSTDPRHPDRPELIRRLHEFDIVIIGPVHRVVGAMGGSPSAPAPLDGLGKVWFALHELQRRPCVLVALLPVREEVTPLQDYDGRTSWSLRGSTLELLALAGWPISSMLKVADEPSIFCGPGFEGGWGRHMVERDDTIEAPGLLATWAAYLHGGVRAGVYSWGTARVIALPYDPRCGLGPAESRFILEAAALMLKASGVVPMVADLRIGPKDSQTSAGYCYLADDDRLVVRLERKEAAFLLAFLLELSAAGVPRVPDHVIEARLGALGYEEKKLSSLRARVNTKLRGALESWRRTAYNVFEFEGGCTWLTYPDQFTRVLGPGPE